MPSLPEVYTTLRVLSTVLLTINLILGIAINIAPLGEYEGKLVAVNVYYYLWYVKISLLPDEHRPYSQGGIVACRVLASLALAFTLFSICVLLHGVKLHWGRIGITRHTNVLLYISLSLSFVALMLFVAFLITFRMYFDSETMDSADYSMRDEVATSSWQGGMQCAIAATVLCMASFTLDFIVLRMSPMMEKYAADVDAQSLSTHQHQTRPAGTKQRRRQRTPQPPAAAPAYGEPVAMAMPSQQQQAWHLQPVPAAPVFGQPLELYPPAPTQGEGNNSNYGVNSSAPYQYISRSE